MSRKLLFLLITTLFITTGVAQADPEEIVFYDLSLAGYRLGMSFDEAAEVRPFQYTQESRESTLDATVVDAFIDQVYLDGIETRLRLYFREGRASKIVVRFPPDEIDKMMHYFINALGACENRSRVLTNRSGAEIHQTVCQWIYPNAKLYLIKISSNAEFATISLIEKRRDLIDAEAPPTQSQ
jgi:hypothetical protein